MADEKRDVSSNPQDPAPIPAEEQEHEGSWPASDQNPAAHPEDTDNREQDDQAVQGPDEDPDGAVAADDGGGRPAMDYPRAAAASSEIYDEADLPHPTHPDLRTEVGLPDPNVDRDDEEEE